MKKFILILMYVIVTVNIGLALYFILSPRDKTAPVATLHTAPAAPVIAKEPDRETEMTIPPKENEKSTNVIAASARVVSAEPQKVNAIVSKKPVLSTTPDVLPPDESDAGLLSGIKNAKPAVKKIVSKNDDDILADNGAANGFNTGIKKTAPKTNTEFFTNLHNPSTA